MNDIDVPCYIARCKCGCGALTFASVDEPEQSQERSDDTAKEIAALVRDGFTIERMPVGDVRSANWKCTSKAAGPQIVCAGCGEPTGLYAPLCDQCARNYVELVGEVPSCALCNAGLPVKRGIHTTKTGGYAGKCAVIFESSSTSNPSQESK